MVGEYLFFFAVAVLFAIPGYLAGRAAAKALFEREKETGKWDKKRGNKAG